MKKSDSRICRNKKSVNQMCCASIRMDTTYHSSPKNPGCITYAGGLRSAARGLQDPNETYKFTYYEYVGLRVVLEVDVSSVLNWQLYP